MQSVQSSGCHSYSKAKALYSIWSLYSCQGASKSITRLHWATWVHFQYPISKTWNGWGKKDHFRSNCRGQTLGCHSSLNGNPAPQMKELSWMLPSHVSLSTCIVRSEPQIDLGLFGERHLLRGIYLKNQGTFDIPCFWQSWVMISFLLELLDPSKQRDITNHLFLSFYHTPIPIIPVSFGIMLSIAIPYYIPIPSNFHG